MSLENPAPMQSVPKVMDNSQTVWEALRVLGPIIGPGGVGAIIIAYFGVKSARRKADAEKPIPIQIESPWLVQNLLEIKLNVDAANDKIASVVQSIATLAVQVNTLSVLLRRRKRD